MKKSRIISMCLFAIGVLFAGFFCYAVFSSNLLPQRLSLIFTIALALVFLLLGFLVFHKKSNFLIMLGGILAILLGVVFLVGSLYLNRAVTAAQNITTTKKEVAAISVYMLADNADENTFLTAQLRYGILEVQDRENTDVVLEKLSKELDHELNVQAFENTASMIDSLYEHTIDAVVVNNAFLDILSEMEGYSDVKGRLVEVRKTHIEREVPVTPAPTEQSVTQKDETPGITPASWDKEYPRCFTVYLSGNDTDVGIVEKARSDVNILAVVNTETHQVLLVTTPRDYYVELPISYGMKDKLTHAGIYGVDVSIGTLEMLYDVDIDYYFRVDFSGFEKIATAMGGVTVYSEKSFSGLNYYFPEGYNELSGAKALEFVRTREGIGDQQRGRNQMAFIKGMINKATSTDMLLNFSSIMSAIEGAFETSMPYDVMTAIVRDQLASGAQWNIVMYNVTGEGNSLPTYSGGSQPLFVFVPDMSTVQKAQDMMRQVYNGEILSEP